MAVWDEHFKTILLLLLETLGDKDVCIPTSSLCVCVCVCGCSSEIFGVTERLCPPQHTIRALALRVLKEILRNQPARFKNYAELTIMKTLEAHKDSHKEVNRCVSVHPVVSLHDYPNALVGVFLQKIVAIFYLNITESRYNDCATVDAL